MLLDDELEIFLVIEKTKSFSQAAKLLHMSRPALSNRIELIESKYGVSFYNRTSLGVTKTEAGHIITEYAKNMKKMKIKMDRDLAALKESFIPSLTIGASMADGAYILPGIIKGFLHEHPDAKIHVDVCYEPELFEKMYNSEIDFAIIEDQCINNDFECHLLGYKRLVCLAPNLPPWDELRQPVEYSKLLPLPMIIYEWESGRHNIGDRHFRKHHNYGLRDHNPIVRFDTYDAMIQGVIAGLGYGMFPTVVAEKYFNHPKVMTLNLKTNPIYYEVNLVNYKMRELSTEAKNFVQYLKTNYPQNYFEPIEIT